jgi:hypothetical protein
MLERIHAAEAGTFAASIAKRREERKRYGGKESLTLEGFTGSPIYGNSETLSLEGVITRSPIYGEPSSRGVTGSFELPAELLESTPRDV